MTLLTNARLVLPMAVMTGSLLFDTHIRDIAAGGSAVAGAIDCGGDFVIPGAIDLHTDNLERQVQPRHRTRWPSRPAMIAHDAHCAAAGITTVFDALCVGDLGFDEDRHRSYVEGAADLLTCREVMRVAHYLHLRCELPATDMLEKFLLTANHPLLRMISLMDHTPGFGQYADMARYKTMRAGDGEAPDITERRIVELAAQRARLRDGNRRALLDLIAGRQEILLASHDDRTVEEIADNADHGVMVSEFPVTIAAAEAARGKKMGIIAGAPNIVRGGSHTGNVAVAELAARGLLDALASDYVPASMIEACFRLSGGDVEKLPAAIAFATSGPAAMAGFDDRGALQCGLRADLVQVALHQDSVIVRAAWCAGKRVA
jgi:alpha-D-ribose 1-methylphosphonate 5-triphosphate diphosphatase